MRYVGSAVPCCAGCADKVPNLTSSAVTTRSQRSPAAVGLRDPHAMKVAALRSGQSMGDLLPTIVFPADVAAYKRKVDPAMKSTQRTVESACANLPSDQAIAWGDFYTDWRKFADAPTALLASWEAQLNLAKRFESELADWQELIAKSCALSAPPIVVPSGPFPTGAVLLGVGVVVLASAIGYSFYKTGQQAARRANQGRRLLEDQVDRRISAQVGGAGKSNKLARA